MIKKFAIMGVGGYVAVKHLQSIKALGHEVVAALDIHDSVGIIDRFFPHCHFFTSFERFERFLSKERRDGQPVDYLVVCTPNHLHDAHCRFGLRMKMNVICEKPLVINPWNVDALIEAENDSGYSIANILQLRYHPEIVKLADDINRFPKRRKVILDYHTPRGKWYDVSWKGNVSKSGGITTNIGVHLFDLLLWLFGELVEVVSVKLDNHMATGQLKLEGADVEWRLSTELKKGTSGSSPARFLQCDEKIIYLDKGFDNLHLANYEKILAGEKVRPIDIKPLIDLLYRIRMTDSN